MAGLFPGLPVEFPDSNPTPNGSLVASAASPPSESLQDEKWLGGIQWAPHICSDGNVLDPCDTNQTDTVAATAASGATALLGEIPYLVSHGIRASTRGFEEIDYEGRATNTLIRNQSKLIEKEFWEGAKATTDPNLSGNYFLSGNATDIGTILGDGSNKAYKVKKGFAELEKIAMDRLGGAQCMIHVSPDLITYLNAIFAIDLKGNVIYTTLGNIVVAGAGYTGAGPANLEEDSTGKTSWAYATAVATLWLSKITVTPFERAQAIDKSINLVEYRASRFVSVTLDHCVNLTVRLDLENS